jgi:NTP pyrophosphatase (non-canonical NTP hydrolase)
MIKDLEYAEFVQSVTSDYSKDNMSMLSRMEEMSMADGVKTSHLLTAALGLTGEAGEFADHVKKIFFHGKAYDDDRREAMILELGDIMWYVMQACEALEVSLEEVVYDNIDKLSERHPDGFKKDYKS